MARLAAGVNGLPSRGAHTPPGSHVGTASTEIAPDPKLPIVRAATMVCYAIKTGR